MSVDEVGNGKWTAIGSAFPARIDNNIYLITAAHCVKDLDGMPIYVCTPYATMITLYGCMAHVDNDLDIAAIPLPVSKFSQMFPYGELVETDAGRPHIIGSDIYVLAGFPRSKHKMVYGRPFDRNLLRITLGKAAYLSDKPKTTCDHNQLIIRDLDPNNMVDDNRNPISAPGISGMSGGPVIQYAKRGEAYSGRIVGVFIEWHKKDKAAVAISWSVINNWLAGRRAPYIKLRSLLSPSD